MYDLQIGYFPYAYVKETDNWRAEVVHSDATVSQDCICDSCKKLPDIMYIVTTMPFLCFLQLFT